MCLRVDLSPPAYPWEHTACVTRQKCILSARFAAAERYLFDESSILFSAGFLQHFKSLTLTLLIFRGFNKTLELYVDVDLYSQQQGHFQQH